MVTITLVRHGNTDANNEGWIQGQLDTVLNKNGLGQAKRCGERLKHSLFDHVYCSDLKRCRQTAEAILFHHHQLTIEYLPGLREAGFGDLSGLSIKVLSKESRERKSSINQCVIDHGGEGIQEFEKRVLNTFNAIMKDAKEKNYKSILVVTHGGPLRSLTTDWLLKKYQAVDPSLNISPVPHGNTAVTKIEITDDGKGHIYKFNSISHLDAKIEHYPPPAV